MIGDNQVDYRFFIGFKLLLNEQELFIQSVSQEIKKDVHEFLNGVNHRLMGDFVSMSNAEIDRFSKMENLLESKISRRFKIRKLDNNDFGYIIEHIYGVVFSMFFSLLLFVTIVLQRKMIHVVAEKK